MICFIVTSRADVGPLFPVMSECIERGLNVQCLPMPSSDNPILGYANSAFVSGVAFQQQKPQLVVILGDRYEALAAAGAATMATIPIAHIHGGEITRGSFDDSLRDAITRMADIHFVAAPEYGSRLMKMGERNIHVVGAPGLDNIKFVEQREKEKRFVVTYHPATRTQETIVPLLSALEKYPDYRIVFTGANNDPGAPQVGQAVSEFAKYRPNVILDDEMNAVDYLSLCTASSLVIGNSSAGLIEIPSLGIPTVDIGERQSGRLRGPSVFHAESSVESISDAIDRALKYDGPYENPHLGPGASAKIADVLYAQFGPRVH